MLGCGLLLEWSTWRSTFVATAVLATAAFVAALKLAPNTKDPNEAVIDLPGFVLSGVGIGALVFGIVDGAEAGWTTTNAVAGLAAATAALIGFVAWELRVAKPMLDVRLFRLRGFSTGALTLTIQFLCLYGFFFVGLQFLQLTLGYSALLSAAALLPMAAIVMPMSKMAPQLVDRLGQRAVMTSGLLLIGRGPRRHVATRRGIGVLALPRRAGVFGIGMALSSTPSTTAIVTSLPRSKQGVASAMNDVSRELGSALGIAILGSLFSSGYRAAIGDAASTLPPEAGHAVEESAGAGLAVASQLGPIGHDLTDAVQSAFAVGLADAMVAGAAIAVTAALFTAWRAPRRQTPNTPDLQDVISADLAPTVSDQRLPELV